jgi:TetR/AcrR family transcriptional regulator
MAAMAEAGETESKRSRDPGRSREALLAAAERLFADRGFEGASLTEIGAAAGLSRGTPSYFFGSKEGLYRAVLERAFEDRDRATATAFRPVREWDGSGGSRSLRAALAEAISAYMDFLSGHPSFQRLIQREELAGGKRLRGVERESSAIREAFEALRSRTAANGLGDLDVDDAVLVCVSLTYSPLAQNSTFMATLGRDLEDPATRERLVELVAGQLLALLGGTGSARARPLD